MKSYDKTFQPGNLIRFRMPYNNRYTKGQVVEFRAYEEQDDWEDPCGPLVRLSNGDSVYAYRFERVFPLNVEPDETESYFV